MSGDGFRDRIDAGQRLGDALGRFKGRAGLLVLGLPRGGVPVAAEVARKLAAPLDVMLVRKLGAPGQPELAVGAIASGGVTVLNQDVVDAFGLGQQAVEDIAGAEARELQRRERIYRGDRPALDLHGRTVIVVDDGLATGASMRAAARAVRALGAEHVVIAVPVGAAETCESLKSEADEVVCLATPEPFQAVGLWYRHFEQISDREVIDLLAD